MGELLFTIAVENRAGGAVQILRSGQQPQTVGHVLRGCTRTIRTFAAASYNTPSSVAAVSVHGIRLRLPSSQAYPVGISLQPIEFERMPAGYGGHIPGPSAIVTDIGAGASIFRELSPLVGSEVMLQRGGESIEFPTNWKPEPSDVILIRRHSPEIEVEEIRIANQTGGAVEAVYADGTSEQIARVTQPLAGVGRFDGTSYTGVGCINTNHSGVITISTAPVSRPIDEGAPPESRGGFEIQPSHHARTQPYMPQALVVEPLTASETLEGMPPLFRGVLWLGDGKSVVDIKTAGGGWAPMPKMIGKIDDAFTAAGMSRVFGRESGALEQIRIRVGKPDLTSQVTLSEKPTIQPSDTKPVQFEWTLEPPYGENAASVLFVILGQTVSITNIKPYRLTLAPSQTDLVIEARIRDISGVTIETRKARARFGSGRWVISREP